MRREKGCDPAVLAGSARLGSAQVLSGKLNVLRLADYLVDSEVAGEGVVVNCWVA